MNHLVDMHSHTFYSDGKLSPSELLTKAKKAGLSGISITDHDTIDGNHEAIVIAKNIGIDFLPGIEVSCIDEGTSIHLLAYNMQLDNPEFNTLLKRNRDARVERAKKILELLREKNRINIELDEVLEQAGKAPITRPHIAQILVKRRLCYNSRQAFMRYLGHTGSTHVQMDSISAKEAITVLKQAGATTSIAHPADYIKRGTIMRLVSYGLDAVEVIHPSHDFKTRKRLHEMCNQMWLMETGGSDYHGYNLIDNKNFSKHTVSYSIFEKIRANSNKPDREISIAILNENLI